MTPIPNKHRRVRECLGEWRRQCILHSIFGGNTRAVARMVVKARTRPRASADPEGAARMAAVLAVRLVVVVSADRRSVVGRPMTVGSAVRSV